LFQKEKTKREREGVVWQGASPTFDDFEQAGLQGDDFYSVMQPMPFHLKIKKKIKNNITNNSLYTCFTEDRNGRTPREIKNSL
jgi:hypothetical protein